MAGRSISRRQARLAWEQLEALPIVRHPLQEDLPRVVEVALGLQRRSAYDAAYVALAQELGAVLWTLDGSLARSARAAGFPVRRLDETNG